MDPDDAVLLTVVGRTGYQAAEMAGIQKGDTVAVFGAGPVGYHGSALRLALCLAPVA
jgi:threonine dehydrogenase-like Zn-dependent dehydrogenase